MPNLHVNIGFPGRTPFFYSLTKYRITTEVYSLKSDDLEANSRFIHKSFSEYPEYISTERTQLEYHYRREAHFLVYAFWCLVMKVVSVCRNVNYVR